MWACVIEVIDAKAQRQDISLVWISSFSVHSKMLVNMHTLNDLQMDVCHNINDFIIAKNTSRVKAKLRLWPFMNGASTTSVCASSSYSPV